MRFGALENVTLEAGRRTGWQFNRLFGPKFNCHPGLPETSLNIPVLDGPGDGEEAVDGDGRVVQQRAQRRERRGRPPHLNLLI